MISKERIEELEDNFWEESNDEDTQLWREELSEEEKQLVHEWDMNYRKGFLTLCKKIINPEGTEK